MIQYGMATNDPVEVTLEETHTPLADVAAVMAALLDGIRSGPSKITAYAESNRIYATIEENGITVTVTLCAVAVSADADDVLN